MATAGGVPPVAAAQHGAWPWSVAHRCMVGVARGAAMARGLPAGCVLWGMPAAAVCIGGCCTCGGMECRCSVPLGAGMGDIPHGCMLKLAGAACAHFPHGTLWPHATPPSPPAGCTPSSLHGTLQPRAMPRPAPCMPHGQSQWIFPTQGCVAWGHQRSGHGPLCTPLSTPLCSCRVPRGENILPHGCVLQVAGATYTLHAPSLCSTLWPCAAPLPECHERPATATTSGVHGGVVACSLRMQCREWVCGVHLAPWLCAAAGRCCPFPAALMALCSHMLCSASTLASCVVPCGYARKISPWGGMVHGHAVECVLWLCRGWV